MRHQEALSYTYLIMQWVKLQCGLTLSFVQHV